MTYKPESHVHVSPGRAEGRLRKRARARQYCSVSAVAMLTFAIVACSTPSSGTPSATVAGSREPQITSAPATDSTPPSDAPRTASPPTAAASPSVMTSASPPGSSISGKFDVNGRELFIDCAGSGSPTIVIEAGEEQTSDEMADVKATLAREHMVCSYDRANNGQSGSAPKPRTAQSTTSDLDQLLDAAAVPAPYVLIGHSAGGMLVQLFAREHSDEVAGMLVTNAVPPCDPWMDAAFEHMTTSEQDQERSYYAGAYGESLDYCESSHEIDAAPDPTNMPVEVLISTIAQCASVTDVCGRTYPAYTEVMQDVAAEWPAGHFSQVESIHSIYVGDPETFVETVELLLRRIAEPTV
jgi:pimeloyl-ACP methyl ester carboxylesterase